MYIRLYKYTNISVSPSQTYKYCNDMFKFIFGSCSIFPRSETDCRTSRGDGKVSMPYWAILLDFNQDKKRKIGHIGPLQKSLHLTGWNLKPSNISRKIQTMFVRSSMLKGHPNPLGFWPSEKGHDEPQTQRSSHSKMTQRHSTLSLVERQVLGGELSLWERWRERWMEMVRSPWAEGVS